MVLYAIIDTASDKRLYSHVVAEQDFACLFAGKLETPLERVSPYLVRLIDGSGLVAFWRREGWGKSWGIFCTSNMDLPELRQHFRKFLQAKLPDGQIVLFRFYDPRVFRTFLPTCNISQLAEWFSCIDEFRVEASQEASVTRYRVGPGGLVIS